MTMTTSPPKHRVNLSVTRVQEMDDREMYNLTDCYVKGRLSRFAIDPEDQAALAQREMPKNRRDMTLSDTNEVFESVKKQVYLVLYAPEVLPRHRFALDQMRRSVEDQLSENDDETGDWRRAARSFLDMVKDELGRADVMLQEHRENSARVFLARLLEAVQEHRDAPDDDVDDDKLYDVADEIAEALTAQALWGAAVIE